MRILRSRWFLLIVLLFGGGALWRYVIADWLAERDLRAYAAEARARGLRWTLAEYRPAPVPPEDDAALLPVFASPKNYAILLKQVPILPKGKKRKDGAPRAIDWHATRKKLADAGLPNDSAEPDDFRALEAAARVFQPLIDQLHASKATAGNWGDAVWKADLNADFPANTTAMKCFSLLQFRSRLDLALGRATESRRSVEAQLRLSRVFRKMPTLISHLVATVGEALASETIREGIEVDAWDDETLRTFLTHFRESNELLDFQWTMETERAWARDVGRALIDDPNLLIRVLGFAGPSLTKMDEWLLRLAIYRPAWRINNQIWHERAQDELAGMIDAKAGVWKPIDLRFDPAKLSESDRKFRYALAAQSMNMMHAFVKKAVWIQAQNKLTALACALELARRASGNYPPSLDALVPTYFTSLPIDPTSGASFRYTVQPDGSYKLYSVGFDRIDQGGEITNDDVRSTEDPDWPWIVPHPSGAVR